VEGSNIFPVTSTGPCWQISRAMPAQGSDRHSDRSIPTNGLEPFETRIAPIGIRGICGWALRRKRRRAPPREQGMSAEIRESVSGSALDAPITVCRGDGVRSTEQVSRLLGVTRSPALGEHLPPPEVCPSREAL
jgi:hypothetical protein